MSPQSIEKIIIRHGYFTGRNIESPKVKEIQGQDFIRTGIILKSGLQLADYIIPLKAPELLDGIEIGQIRYQDNHLMYLPSSQEIGNILRRTQFNLDIIPDIAADEYAPKIEDMQEHILPSNQPHPLRRGDIILIRAYDERISNISGTYVELHQIIRNGEWTNK